MDELDKRSLKKNADNLKPIEKRFLAKYTCDLKGCGADFVFSIAKEAYEQENAGRRKFSGACGKCGQRILLNGHDFKRWNTLIDGSELKITDTTFDDLFSDNATDV